MEDILQVQTGPIFDTSIAKIEEQTINPSNPQALENNDVIQFYMNQSDSLTLLKDSYFIVSGKIRNKDDTDAPSKAELANAAVLHLFNRAELKINNQTVEQIVEPALTCIPKIYGTYNDGSARHLQVMGWNSSRHVTAKNGNFSAIIPFKVLFGMGEDFRQVLVNAKIEILLTRARSNTDALVKEAGVKDDEVKLTLLRMQYKLPFVSVDDAHRLQLLKLIEKDKPLKITFRSWELFRYPELPTSNTQTWSIKTSSQIEKPRFVILFFQTNRSGKMEKSSSEFDHCDLRNVKLKLNNESFPYDDLDQDFDGNNYGIFYNMYCNFSSSFNAQPDTSPLLDYDTYKSKAPLFIIDCSRQRETLKYGPIDVRLDFESRKSFPAKTTANCIIVHDTVYEYQPLTNTIRKHEG